MGGFFVFGPVGAIAGALFGIGLALRFNGGSRNWARRLLSGAAGLIVLGGLVLAVTAFPDRGPSYSNVIEFQLEFPFSTLSGVIIPSTAAMWGAGGGTAEASIISQFFNKQCEKDTCILNGSVAALGPMNNFRVVAQLGVKRFTYLLNLPSVAAPVDWSPWIVRDGARVRWRIVPR